MKRVAEEDEWWPRAELARHVQIGWVGQPSYEHLVNRLLRDPSADVGIVAAELVAIHRLTVSSPIDDINPIAQLALKRMGSIGARRGGPCPVSAAFQFMLGASVHKIDWRKLLGRHYKAVVVKAARLRGYSETDATAWVNLLDTVHDDLLDSLFQHESGALGKYVRGNIGGALGSAGSRFARKYPMSYKAFRDIHEKRLRSFLSHSETRTTGRKTSYIEFDYIAKVTPRLRAAYLEIWSKW
jgi:hypothetical protein